MAVLDDIEVTVQVDEQDLKEYYDHDGEHADDASISKYIEAVSRAKFEVVASVSTSHKLTSDALGLEISIDGNLVARGLLRKHRFLGGKNMTTHVKRAIKGVSRFGDEGWELRPFTFTEINAGGCR